MGLKLLIVSIGSLILIIWFIDFFTVWYAEFLKRWMPYAKIRVLLGQLVWAIMALVFWAVLFRDGSYAALSPSHFVFVLFIYSIRGLVGSLTGGRGQKSI